MVLNRIYFEYILFIMFVLGQHERNYKESAYWWVAGEHGNCKYYCNYESS